MRRGALLVLGLVTSSVLTGCGFLEELAHPPVTPVAAPVSTTPRPTPTPPPATPVLTAQLLDDRQLPGGPFRGSLLVDAHPVTAGLPPLDVTFPTDCGLEEATTRHLAVDLTFTDRPGAVTVVSAGVSVSGPAVDAGVVGLFVESSDSDVWYCRDGDRTPSADHLVLGATEATTVTAYLVVGPDAPDDALTGLTVALTDLRDPVAGGSGRDGPWTVVGGPASSCLDAPGGLCVSVG
ncbi:hypothetical protein O2W14_07515 [Modestobacter sp. VKM Ac-2986]|uniref:hypothetical protein n=1 Tax=Modestobacter sp. VKM Ac-2986 TaxID=3004140 RepID=UPI0022AA2871|nr:hypothetical protein [Modestobacter sp. VKM Ac-2986]MCZ2828674.1 hypothetical protein [Modestobacter sp. VKM Ac-2986]